jgi:TRAP-type C4-dicarboxylate transport system substrate-binding protein
MRKISMLGAIFMVLVWNLTAHPTVEAKVLLKIGSAWERNITFSEEAHQFIRIINKLSKGEIETRWQGGAEIFPPFEIHEFMRKGVIDITNVAPTFYQGALPAAYIINISEDMSIENRKKGLNDLLDKIHRKHMNAVYLGRQNIPVGWMIALKNPAKTPEEIRGRKLRTTPQYVAVFKALGAIPVNIASHEVYGALEKGLVEGYGWPDCSHIERKFYEVAKYHISHTWGRVGITMIMNLDSWNRLSPQHQKILKDAMIETEAQNLSYWNKTIAEERKKLREIGVVKSIKFSEDNAKKYRSTIINACKEEMRRLAPEYASELLRLGGVE